VAARYEGGLNAAGQAEGHGVCTWVDGGTYSGEWRRGTRHGSGRGDGRGGTNGQGSYRGEWCFSKWHGHGTARMGGATYTGQFRANLKEGRGVCRFADGDSYSGQWLNDMQHGVGTYAYLDGQVEVGGFAAHRDLGIGVRWSADRQTAWRMHDGKVLGEISLPKARALAGKLGLPVPPVTSRAADEPAAGSLPAPLYSSRVPQTRVPPAMIMIQQNGRG
jgi:hypothetical protein